MRYTARLGVAALALSLLAGCGGGGDSSSTVVQDGYLVGGLIEHVPYACGAQKGRTDRLGQFKFVYGDSCVFSVGKLRFPVASDKLYKGYVTPYDLTATREAAWTLMAILDSISHKRPNTDLFVIVDGNLERRIIAIDLAAGDKAVASALATFQGTVRAVTVNEARVRLAKTVRDDNALVGSLDSLIAQGSAVLASRGLSPKSGTPFAPPKNGLLTEINHQNVVNLRFYDGSGNPFPFIPDATMTPVSLPYMSNGTQMTQYVTPGQNNDNNTPQIGDDYADITGSGITAIMLDVGRSGSTDSGTAFKNAAFAWGPWSPITLPSQGADPKPGTNAHFPPTLNFAFSLTLNFPSGDGNDNIVCPNLIFTQGGTKASLSAWLNVMKDLSDMILDGADMVATDGTDIDADVKFLTSFVSTALDVAQLASENWWIVGVNAQTPSTGTTLNGDAGILMTCTGVPPWPYSHNTQPWPVVIQSTYDDHTFDIHVPKQGEKFTGFSK